MPLRFIKPNKNRTKVTTLNDFTFTKSKKPKMPTTLIKKAENLLSLCDVCQVASVSEDGFPRICILKPLKNLGIREFWFSTGSSGTKVRHFKKNDKAGVTYYHGGDSITLTGHVEIVSDSTVKNALWKTWSHFLAKHFPNGGKDDPEFCILHFTAQEATIYVDGEFKTFAL